jgi:hypothetical protein
VFQEFQVTDPYQKFHLDTTLKRSPSVDLYAYKFFENTTPSLPLLGFKLHTKENGLDGTSFLVEPIFKIVLLSEILKTFKVTGTGLVLKASAITDTEGLKQQSLLPYFSSAGIPPRAASALSDRMLLRVKEVSQRLKEDAPTLT